MLSDDAGKMSALYRVATSLVPDCMYRHLIAVLEGLVGHRNDTFAQVKEQVGGNWGSSPSHQCTVKMSISQHNHPDIITTVCLDWGCTAVKYTYVHIKMLFNRL